MNMEQPKFRLPKDMIKKEPRTTISARIKRSTADLFLREARANKIPLSQLISQVLDQYAEWVGSQKKGR